MGKSVRNNNNVKITRVACARACSSGQHYYCIRKYFILKNKVSSPLIFVNCKCEKVSYKFKIPPYFIRNIIFVLERTSATKSGEALIRVRTKFSSTAVPEYGRTIHIDSTAVP
jgi:hypothetical protein